MVLPGEKVLHQHPGGILCAPGWCGSFPVKTIYSEPADVFCKAKCEGCGHYVYGRGESFEEALSEIEIEMGVHAGWESRQVAATRRQKSVSSKGRG